MDSDKEEEIERKRNTRRVIKMELEKETGKQKH